MNLTKTLLGEAWYWAAWAVWLPLFARCLLKAPWRLFKSSELMHVWLGMVVALTLIWSMRAGVRPGLDFHLLGATVFTLCFGPYLAFLGLCVVIASVALNGDADFFPYAANALLVAGGGVLLSQGLSRLFSTLFPKHFFVYIFANGFLTAALTVIGVGVLSSLLLGLAGAYAWDYLWAEYFPYFLLLGFAEAWLSGMLMTLFVVYRPSWVSTFDDRHYLDGH